MSGIIDEHGQQWEHCNVCHGWVRLEELRYEPPSDAYPYGRDLCESCAAPGTPLGKPIMVIVPRGQAHRRSDVRPN